MSELDRRAFVSTVAAALPVLGAASAFEQVAPVPLVGGGVDPELLRALAEAILPAELGEAGVARVATGFQAWLAGYEPEAEVNHGYGTPEIEYLPADPRPGWQEQLVALGLEAERQWGMTFVALHPDRRRLLVGRQLSTERSGRLPAAHEARHVAVGLLAWFYTGAEATDLCYRARIGKETCRPLAQTTAEPTEGEKGETGEKGERGE
jgi:hypothetical protein